MCFSQEEVEKIVRDYQELTMFEYDEKYQIKSFLHTWTIEHYKGVNLPVDFSLYDAFDDYELYKNDPEFPDDLLPWQLHFEVITLIIEADAGNPF